MLDRAPGDQGSIFDESGLTEDESAPRDCPMKRCGGKGQWFDEDGELVTCPNCKGTGRAVIPF